MTTLIFLRHGEADGNKKQILMGCREWSFLTKTWIQQIGDVWEYLTQHESVDHIFSSPVQRAKQSAEIISSTLWKEINYIPALREVDWWDVSGLPLSEIPCDISSNFHADPFGYIHPNGESLELLFERISIFFENFDFTQYANETLLFVTHDNVIKAIIAEIEGIWSQALKLKIPNASLTYFQKNNNGFLRKNLWKIVYE